MTNEIEVVIKSKADSSGFKTTAKGLDEIRQRIRDLSRQKITVDTDIAAIQTKLRTLRGALKTASDQDKITIQADIDAAMRRLGTLRDRAKQISLQKASLSVDASQAEAELRKLAAAMRQTETRSVTLGDRMRRLGEYIGTHLAVNVIGRGLQAFTGFIGDSVRAASDLGESVNAVGKIFGESAAGIMQWGKDNAASFGLSRRSFNELATPLGAFLKNTGMGMADVSKNTIDLTKRAADMASVFNTSVSDAMEAIQSGLKGEQDPLERFGVSLSAAAVQAEAMRLGLVKTAVDQDKLAAAQMRAQIAQRAYSKAVKEHGATSDQAKRAQLGVITAQNALEKATGGSTVALTKQQQTQAALSLIMNQTKDVAGDFASTSNQLANSQRIAAARSEDLKAQLGQKLLPVTLMVTRAKLALVDVVANKILPAFTAFGSWVGRNRELLLALAIGITAVLVPAFISWAVAAGAAAVATIAAAAPVIAIAALIAALALGIIKLAKHWDTVSGVMIRAVRAVWNWIKQYWPYLVGMLAGPFGLAAAWVYRHWNAVLGFVRGLGGKMAAAGKGMWNWVTGGLKVAVNAVLATFESMLNAAIRGLNSALNAVDVAAGPWVNFGQIPEVSLPRLAAGAIVRARPGGTLAVLGEGGRDEAVVPLGSGAGMPQTITLVIESGGSAVDNFLVEILRRAVRVRGGNVQLVLGRS